MNFEVILNLKPTNTEEKKGFSLSPYKLLMKACPLQCGTDEGLLSTRGAVA